MGWRGSTSRSADGMAGRSFVLSPMAGLALVSALAAWGLLSRADAIGAVDFAGALLAATAAWCLGEVAGRAQPTRTGLALALGLVMWFLSHAPASLEGGAAAPPLGYANANAALLSAALVAALLASKGARGAERTWCALSIGALVLLAVAVGSRAGLVSMGLLLVVWPLLERGSTRAWQVWATLALATGTAMTAIVATTWHDAEAIVDTLSGTRIRLWSDAVALLAENPVRGVGAGEYAWHGSLARTDADLRWAHSAALQLAAELGLVGAALATLLLVWLMARLHRCAAILSVLALQPLVDHVLDEPLVLITAAFALGTLVGTRGAWGTSKWPELTMPCPRGSLLPSQEGRTAASSSLPTPEGTPMSNHYRPETRRHTSAWWAALAATALLTALLPGLGTSHAATGDHALLVSAAPDRSSPLSLDGTTQTGSIYVFTHPATGVSRVRFWLDDPTMSGTPRQVEKGAPHDFAGTASNGKALPFDTSTVPVGTHVITAALDLTSGGTVVLSGTFDVEQAAPVPTPYSLLLSTAADRSGPTALDGSQVAGNVYVFTGPDSGVTRVRFYVDDPTRAGTPYHSEGKAPYDLAGTASSGQALPFDTRTLSDGEHVVTAAVDRSDGATDVISGTFMVQQPPEQPDLTVDRSSLSMVAVAGGAADRETVSVGTQDGVSTTFSTTSSASWLAADPASGSTPATVDIVATPGTLATGTHAATLTVSAPGYDSVSISVSFTVRDTAGGTFDVVMSTSATRTSPVLLEGRTVSGSIYAFLAPDTDVTSTRWWLDDPDRAGSVWQVDGASPFDFMPSSKRDRAVAFKTASVPDGTHRITVEISTADGGVHVVTSTFVTDNDTNALTWTPGSATFAVDPASPEPVTVSVDLTATTPGTVATLVGGDPFVTFPDGTQVTTPATIDLVVDPAGLSRGYYTFKIDASAPGAFSDSLDVTLEIGDSQGCAPIACDLIRVESPYVLPFDGPQGLLVDSNGTGTGFTTLLPVGDSRFVRTNLAVDPAASSFDVTATSGSFKENTQDNALGVGFNGGAFNVVTTTLTKIPELTGHYQQAGLWFGYDQDNVMKLDLVSTPSGPRVEEIIEVAGTARTPKQGALLDLTTAPDIGLRIKADPVARTLTGEYRVGNGAWLKVGSFDAPGEFFSADAAGIDPLIGTRTFAGVYATKRKAPGTPVFGFGDFSVTGEAISEAGDLEFLRSSHDVSFPTSMVFGPDGRLYVLTLMGEIHALTYDGKDVVADETITSLGSRLALGLTIDPASTADDVVLWVAHSSPSLSSGEADSGAVTRLSGPGFETREDVITGLPRAIANHGPNSLHFGPDGRLFMAIGGNTGGGAANQSDTEFGDRAEQPLSAALLVADPKASGFDGTCADPVDMYSSDDCDVAVFSSGLRNTYDFVFHSNGSIYGPDNGLGVAGSYPPTPTPPCDGFGSTQSYLDGGHNPGEQPDELNLLVQGGYYGHPNPTRDECVFGDGSYQKVAALAGYQPPTHDLGTSKSANGIIEYTGNGFCGAIRGNLLVTNYSVGDDVVALRLSADGQSVIQTTSLVAGFTDPLPLVQAPDGDLIVGEFGGGRVTRLDPVDKGCWSQGAPLPEALLDVGGAAIGDTVYVVGGKTPDGPQSTVYAHHVPTGTWSTVAPVPGTAVENPAVVAVNGKLYVLGGSTAPFSGAVGQAAVYDPSSDAWSSLPPLPTPRGGAVAQHVGGKIYVVGGMTADGASSSLVEVLDLASGTWSTAPAMNTARDNPGSAAIDGVIYVFGGRTRAANGTTLNGALSTVEAFDPATGTWSARAPMPTGRRTAVSAVIDGMALLVGGEGGGDGNAFDATERYDPVLDSWQKLWPMTTPRHGAAGGVVDGRLHVVGGGPTTGSSWTAVHEVFRPPPPSPGS